MAMRDETPFNPGSARIDVVTSDARMLDRALNSAEATLRPLARQRGTGILISRLGPGQYVVEASASVPYGITHQRVL
jgi:hypothetical protein